MDWNDKTGPLTPGAEFYHEDSLPQGSRKGLVNVGKGSGVGHVAPPVALDLLRGPSRPFSAQSGAAHTGGCPGCDGFVSCVCPLAAARTLAALPAATSALSNSTPKA